MIKKFCNNCNKELVDKEEIAASLVFCTRDSHLCNECMAEYLKVKNILERNYIVLMRELKDDFNIGD